MAAPPSAADPPSTAGLTRPVDPIGMADPPGPGGMAGPTIPWAAGPADVEGTPPGGPVPAGTTAWSKVGSRGMSPGSGLDPIEMRPAYRVTALSMPFYAIDCMRMWLRITASVKSDRKRYTLFFIF